MTTNQIVPDTTPAGNSERSFTCQPLTDKPVTAPSAAPVLHVITDADHRVLEVMRAAKAAGVLPALTVDDGRRLTAMAQAFGLALYTPLNLAEHTITDESGAVQMRVLTTLEVAVDIDARGGILAMLAAAQG